MLQDAVEYYSACGLTKYIFVIWSDSKPPPQRITAKFANNHHPKITISQQVTDSLNNRFKPLEGPHTDCIFAVDDDMRVPCEDLELAYEVWRGSPSSLVGFMREFIYEAKTTSLFIGVGGGCGGMELIVSFSLKLLFCTINIWNCTQIKCPPKSENW